MKRKLETSEAQDEPSKRVCSGYSRPAIDRPVVNLLKQYHKHVSTLRDYLLQSLSKACKHRRRCLQKHGHSRLPNASDLILEAELDLLDNTLIGWNDEIRIENVAQLDAQVVQYRQERDYHAQVVSAPLTHTEMLDFCSWRYQRQTATSDQHRHVLLSRSSAAIGKLSRHPWSCLPGLIGQANQWILIQMYLTCSIFSYVSGTSSLTQVSGPALNEMQTLVQLETLDKQNIAGPRSQLTSVSIARHRVLYAMPQMLKNGRYQAGLQAKHILNRHHDFNHPLNLCKHIFPQQFDADPRGLGRAHTSHTRLEQEASRRSVMAGRSTRRLPRRLQGMVLDKLTRLQRRHRIVPYRTILEYYCPVKDHSADWTPISRATSEHQVSAFVRVTVLRVFGRSSFGDGGSGNWRLMSEKIDHFVRLRRHECMTLHEILDGLAVSKIAWLAPSNADTSHKMSLTDFNKRKQLLTDFLYFIFNDFLISLIRCNFYVTESSSHRNRLFYFRHDVWRALSRPAIKEMQTDMLERCNASTSRILSSNNALGVSRVRFVPKDSGMRPIVNLRRKLINRPDGLLQYGRSINNILAPAFHALTYEKTTWPASIGSAIFSAEELLPKLEAFRHRLATNGHTSEPLFFARLDIKSCFDSLPHDRLLEAAKSILAQEEYLVSKYTKGRLLDVSKAGGPFSAKPVWRYASKAGPPDQGFDIEAEAIQSGIRGQGVWIDLASQRRYDRPALTRLLQQHIQGNLVNMDGQIFRQKRGIAQGSVVSSILCSLLYTALEREVVGVVNNRETMLVRLIDDFLLMSTRRDVAEKFMRVMHAGMPEFGVEVKLKKSQVNFELAIDGHAIPRLPAETDFPYCGQTIHTVTLDIGRDPSRRLKSHLGDGITVDYGRSAGRTFSRRMLQSLRLQMKRMLLSMKHNSPETVRRNLKAIFEDIAQKTYRYVRAMDMNKLSHAIVSTTVAELLSLAGKLFRRLQMQASIELAGPGDGVSISTLHSTMIEAFLEAFTRRQTQHRSLISWLTELTARDLIRRRQGTVKAR